MIALICGGRDYWFTPEDQTWLDALAARHAITEIVTGGALGADDCGHAWAVSRHLDTTVMDANWGRHGKAAGPKRNCRMRDYLLAMRSWRGDTIGVIVFPGGRGTASMRGLAHDAGIPMFERQTHG